MNVKSEVVTQLLYGDIFKIVKKKDPGLKLKISWIVIKVSLKKKNSL